MQLQTFGAASTWSFKGPPSVTKKLQKIHQCDMNLVADPEICQQIKSSRVDERSLRAF